MDGLGFEIPIEASDFFSSLKTSRMAVESTHLGYFPAVKRPKRGDHTLVSKIKHEWSYTSSPSVCLSGVGSGNFTFSRYLDRVRLFSEKSGIVIGTHCGNVACCCPLRHSIAEKRV